MRTAVLAILFTLTAVMVSASDLKVSVTPEPASTLLIGGGLIAIGVGAWRKRRSKKTTTNILLAILLLAGAEISVKADTLTFTGQPNNVEQGGQFTAFLGSDPSEELLTYCVDYRNDIVVPSPAYSVNVTDLADAPAVFADTRYGQTSAFAFSTPTVPLFIGTAQDRYAMAAWLILQYNFTSGVTTADDQIQNAVWTLLDTNGATFPANGGTGTYLAQAESWIAGESPLALFQFEAQVVIYSSTDIASTFGQDRYSVGQQEQIGFLGNCPEPNAAALAGLGVALVLTARARHWRRKAR